MHIYIHIYIYIYVYIYIQILTCCTLPFVAKNGGFSRAQVDTLRMSPPWRRLHLPALDSLGSAPTGFMSQRISENHRKTIGKCWFNGV